MKTCSKTLGYNVNIVAERYLFTFKYLQSTQLITVAKTVTTVYS